MTAFDDLSLLRAFIGIVECGSISAAARRLKIPQPTLSRYLRVLEERCDGPLLRRDTHQMSLTQTGRRFLADAKAMVAHAEEADQHLREGQTTLSGHLRLFATIDNGQFIVTRLVSSFLQINPKVTAELALTNRPLHMIQEGCGVGILPSKITDESVIARPAGKITLCLAASPSLVESRPAVKQPAERVRERADLSVAAYRRELDERITHDQLGLDWKGELAAGVLMGSGAVVARWKRLLPKQSSSGSKSEGKRFGVVSWKEIVAAIEKEWGQPWEELRTGRGNNARAIAIWFGRHRAGMKLEQVREQLQARSYTAVAMQVGRLQRQLPHRLKLRKRLRAIARQLNVQCQDASL